MVESHKSLQGNFIFIVETFWCGSAPDCTRRNIRKLRSEKRSGTTFQPTLRSKEVNLLLLYCIYIAVTKDYSELKSLGYLYEIVLLHDKIQNFKTCEKKIVLFCEHVRVPFLLCFEGGIKTVGIFNVLIFKIFVVYVEASGLNKI